MTKKKAPKYTVQAWVGDFPPGHQPHWDWHTPELGEAIKWAFYTWTWLEAQYRPDEEERRLNQLSVSIIDTVNDPDGFVPVFVIGNPTAHDE